jgi:hypothetical protein
MRTVTELENHAATLPDLARSAGAGEGFPIATLDSTSSEGLLLAYDYTPARIPEPLSGILLITEIVGSASLMWARRQRPSRY